MPEITDNLSAPRFIALCFDEFGVVGIRQAAEHAEQFVEVVVRVNVDVAIWDGHRLAAVVHGDGSVTRFDGQGTQQTAQETRKANGKGKRRP